MGLTTAMNTALTGLNAAETTISVVGNNLANSNTVGFKASEAEFATQFFQTMSLGGAPTDDDGGTNPRQIGLGVLVASIAPDFTQGALDISASPTDLAIQGNGFFIVEHSSGEHLYTRNGIFKLNAEHELVTMTGDRVLGFGVDERFEIQRTTLQPLEIPLGERQVALATENAYLTGTLSPTGDLADTPEIIQSDVLYDAAAGNSPITSGTLLTDLRSFDGVTYQPVFEVGTLEFTGRKGGRLLGPRQLDVTAATTVQELCDFVEQATGIRNFGAGEGGSVTGGQIEFVSNNGTGNAVEIDASAFQLTTATGTRTVALPFTSVQSAVGESAICDFLAYDSLGVPLVVRLTAVLEARDSDSTTYRWFADCSDNQPVTGADVAVGTGLVTFDWEGKVTSAVPSTVAIQRNDIASTSPLAFDLDFSQLSGLETLNSSLAVSFQDGFPPGVLTSFAVGEDGVIRGAFSNGLTRDLGQIRLARFANPAGLEQRGENLYAEALNSGLPVEGDPGQQGIGTIVGGALELSNTDIGDSLVELILASTMYRGNTRVISTAQQMIDELLSLRR